MEKNIETMNTTIKKAFGMALGYLAIRHRTLLEMNNYLSKKGFSREIVDAVVQRLEDEKYLDDRMFAKNYLEHRKRNKPKSTFAFRYELKNKGIHSTIIDPLLADYDDLELAFLAITPKIRIWKHLDRESLKKKMFGHLRYRGFSFSVIQSTWQQIYRNTGIGPSK